MGWERIRSPVPAGFAPALGGSPPVFDACVAERPGVEEFGSAGGSPLAPGEVEPGALAHVVR